MTTRQKSRWCWCCFLFREASLHRFHAYFGRLTCLRNSSIYVNLEMKWCPSPKRAPKGSKNKAQTSRLSKCVPHLFLTGSFIWTFFRDICKDDGMSKWHLAHLRFFLFPTVPSWKKIPGWTFSKISWVGEKTPPRIPVAKVKVSRNPQPKKHGFFVILVDKKPASLECPASFLRYVQNRLDRSGLNCKVQILTKNSWKGRRGGRFFEELLKESHGNHSQRSTQISIHLEQFISGIHETNGKSTYMNGWFLWFSCI